MQLSELEMALKQLDVNGPSSVVENHSHSVVVSSAQLSSISAGQALQVTSGSAEGHTHLFTFLKLG